MDLHEPTRIEVTFGGSGETYVIHAGRVVSEIDGILVCGLMQMGLYPCFLCGEWFPLSQMRFTALRRPDGPRHRVAKCPECRRKTRQQEAVRARWSWPPTDEEREEEGSVDGV